jgi:serine/threonine protein phosphatase PrpC
VTFRWEAAGATHVGRVRQGNEDAFVVDPARGVFLVADGMGGHAAGEVASAIAAETVGRALAKAADDGADPARLEQALSQSFHAAHQAIGRRSASDPLTEGMGTTCTACGVLPDGTFRIGHVGDSRAYLLRDGALAQVTRDHTWVQREVDAGRLSPRQARTHRLAHIITRALGVDAAEDPEIVAGALVPGDLLLLATDGLTGMVSDRRLARILRSTLSPQEAAATLIEEANAAGGADNVTAVLVRAL